MKNSVEKYFRTSILKYLFRTNSHKPLYFRDHIPKDLERIYVIIPLRKKNSHLKIIPHIIKVENSDYATYRIEQESAEIYQKHCCSFHPDSWRDASQIPSTIFRKRRILFVSLYFNMTRAVCDSIYRSEVRLFEWVFEFRIYQRCFVSRSWVTLALDEGFTFVVSLDNESSAGPFK